MSSQFWILPSILGSSILYVLSDDRWETISAWIYGFGLSSLFIVSTIFHTISWKKRHLRYQPCPLGAQSRVCICSTAQILLVKAFRSYANGQKHFLFFLQMYLVLQSTVPQALTPSVCPSCRTVEHCLHMFDRMVIYFFIAASYAPW